MAQPASPGLQRINGALQTIKPKDQMGLRPMFNPVAITPDGKWMACTFGYAQWLSRCTVLASVGIRPKWRASSYGAFAEKQS
jgi:hypothetical protein